MQILFLKEFRFVWSFQAGFVSNEEQPALRTKGMFGQPGDHSSLVSFISRTTKITK